MIQNLTRYPQIKYRSQRETAQVVEDILEDRGEDLDRVIGSDFVVFEREFDVEDSDEDLPIGAIRMAKHHFMPLL